MGYFRTLPQATVAMAGNLAAEQGRNQESHWIYPGDVIVLDYSDGSPRPKLLKGKPAAASGGEARLSPRIRSEDRGEFAIQHRTKSAIEPYLSQPLVVGTDQLKTAPHRPGVGPGGTIARRNAYAVGIPDNESNQIWQVYRPGKALIDLIPRKIWAAEAISGRCQTAEPEGSGFDAAHPEGQTEINIGDRLVPAHRNGSSVTYHTPASDFGGKKVISTYGGVAEAGQYGVIVVNRGNKGRRTRPRTGTVQTWPQIRKRVAQGTGSGTLRQTQRLCLNSVPLSGFLCTDPERANAGQRTRRILTLNQAIAPELESWLQLTWFQESGQQPSFAAAGTRRPGKTFSTARSQPFSAMSRNNFARAIAADSAPGSASGDATGSAHPVTILLRWRMDYPKSYCKLLPPPLYSKGDLRLLNQAAIGNRHCSRTPPNRDGKTPKLCPAPESGRCDDCQRHGSRHRSRRTRGRPGW